MSKRANLTNHRDGDTIGGRGLKKTIMFGAINPGSKWLRSKCLLGCAVFCSPLCGQDSSRRALGFAWSDRQIVR
jgi:hypothetical protein